MTQEHGARPVGPESKSASSVDYGALMAEAQAHHYETFADRALKLEQVGEVEFASDLRLVSDIAEQLRSHGERALAVGGYARDEAIARQTGQPLKSKDLDVEVYGMPFDDLAVWLGRFGQVDLVGESFGIAKLKNPSGGTIDFSIPRADSKVDRGHKGFVVTGDPNMTVKEAARRRDLTINALALDPLTGQLIDEYGGLADIEARVLRATDADLFGDDPLRVLRVMQFAGRFDFAVDPATADICRALDLHELPHERIGEEWVKLMTKSERPSVGIKVAKDLLVLEKLHPELAVLERTEQEPEWHPEGNVLNHSMLAADAAARIVRDEGLSGDEALVVLFGALVHDFGKATTTMPREKDGRMRLTSYGHEAEGVAPAKEFLEGLRLNGDVIAMILPIVREHLYHINNPDPTDKNLYKFAERLSPGSIRLWDLVSRCDSNGRGGTFESVTPSHQLYERSLALNVAEAPIPRLVTGGAIIDALGLRPGPQITGILNWLYDHQLDAEFADEATGIAYARAHQPEMQEVIATHLAARREALAIAKAELDAKNAQVKALPRAERQRLEREAYEKGKAARERTRLRQEQRAAAKAKQARDNKPS